MRGTVQRKKNSLHWCGRKRVRRRRRHDGWFGSILYKSLVRFVRASSEARKA